MEKTNDPNFGPWSISVEVGGKSAEGVAESLNLIVENDERHIAFVFDDNPEAARLISAAPDFRDASECYARWVETYGDKIHADTLKAMEAGFGGLLRAALAKARNP